HTVSRRVGSSAVCSSALPVPRVVLAAFRPVEFEPTPPARADGPEPMRYRATLARPVERIEPPARAEPLAEVVPPAPEPPAEPDEIGRASCRGRSPLHAAR